MSIKLANRHLPLPPTHAPFSPPPHRAGLSGHEGASGSAPAVLWRRQAVESVEERAWPSTSFTSAAATDRATGFRCRFQQSLCRNSASPMPSAGTRGSASQVRLGSPVQLVRNDQAAAMPFGKAGRHVSLSPAQPRRFAPSWSPRQRSRRARVFSTRSDRTRTLAANAATRRTSWAHARAT